MTVRVFLLLLIHRVVSKPEQSSKLNTSALIEQFKSTWPVENWKRTGLFDEGYIRLVNPHWLQFPPPPHGVHEALGSLYLLLMLIGCSGNAFVLYMYFRCRSLRSPGNILVVNLAISDFFMLAKTPIFIVNSFYYGPALGKTGCTIYGFLGGLTGTTTIATLSAIAYDRYSVVARPLDPLKKMTHLRAKVLAVSTWLYAGFFSVIPALDIGFGRYVPEGYLTSCSFDYLSDEIKPRCFIFAFFCAAWVAPFIIISFCYIKIAIRAKSTPKLFKETHRLSAKHVKEETARKSENKLTRLVIVVILLFFASWTPYALVSLLGVFWRRDLILPTVSMVPAMLCKSASCINPFIYIMTHTRFRSELNKMMNHEHRSGISSLTAARASSVPNGSGVRRQTCQDAMSENEVEVIELRNVRCGRDQTAASDRLPAVFTIDRRKSSGSSLKIAIFPTPPCCRSPQNPSTSNGSDKINPDTNSEQNPQFTGLR